MLEGYTDTPTAVVPPVWVQGVVEHGRKIASTKLEAPTANLRVSPNVFLPAPGVYAAYCKVDDTLYRSIVNIGTKPTVTDDGILMVEVHLLRYAGNLYGRTLSVLFLYRLRSEKRFDSLALLAQQLQADTAAACVLLPEHPEANVAMHQHCTEF